MRFHDKQRCGIQVCCIILPPTWMIMEPASQAVNRSKVPLHSEVWARSPVEEDVYRVRPEFSNLRLVLIQWSTFDWVLRAGISNSPGSFEGIAVALIVTEKTAAAAYDVQSECAFMVQAANNASAHHSRLRFTIIVISPIIHGAGGWSDKVGSLQSAGP